MSEQIVSFQGSLDLATAEGLEQRVTEALRSHEHVVLDLSQLEFVDSTGVRSLIILKRESAEAGRTLRVAGLNPDMLEILDLLGVREIIVDGP